MLKKWIEDQAALNEWIEDQAMLNAGLFENVGWIEDHAMLDAFENADAMLNAERFQDSWLAQMGSANPMLNAGFASQDMLNAFANTGYIRTPEQKPTTAKPSQRVIVPEEPTIAKPERAVIVPEEPTIVPEKFEVNAILTLLNGKNMPDELRQQLVEYMAFLREGKPLSKKERKQLILAMGYHYARSKKDYARNANYSDGYLRKLRRKWRSHF